MKTVLYCDKPFIKLSLNFILFCKFCLFISINLKGSNSFSCSFVITAAKCSVEVKLFQQSKEKLTIEHLVMNPSKKPSVGELHSVLLHGASEILKRT